MKYKRNKTRLGNMKQDNYSILHNQYVYTYIYRKYGRNNQWNISTISRLQQHRNIGTSSSEHWLHILMMVRLNNMNYKTRLGDRKQNNHSILYDQYIHTHVYRKYMRNDFRYCDTKCRLQ